MAESDILNAVVESQFIFLLRFTQAGITTLHEAPNRVTEIRAFVGQIQARCGFVMTSGPYDAVTLFQGDDAQAYQFLMYLRSRGHMEVDMLKIAAASTERYLELLRPVVAPGQARSARP